MKTENIVLKVAAFVLVGALAAGAVGHFVKPQDEDKTPTVTNGYVATSDHAVALVDNYFENIQKTQYSGTTVSEVTVYSKTDGDLEIGTAKIGVAGEAETQVYAVEAGKNVITLDEPLTVGMDETVIIGGGKTSVDLRTTSSTKSSCGDIATLTDGVLSTDFTVSEERLNISMDVCYMEVGIETPVYDSVVTDCGDISTSNSVNKTSAPFTYQNLTLYENSRITKIGVPVKTVSNYTVDNIFTLYVIGVETTVSSVEVVSEYKLVIPANTYTSNTVNDWYYFDVDIFVDNNQTLAFSSSTDTVSWGYGEQQTGSQYNFYNRLFGAYTSQVYCIYFDIYKRFELNYTLEEYIKVLETENSKAYAQTVLAGKKISILGDSISTLEGISDNVAYNTTLSPNQSRYYAKDVACTTTEATLELTSWEDTYWGQTVNDLNLELCVNNSWRGTSVSTARGASSCTSGTRATQLHNDNENITPDIIVIYIGTNDKSASAPVLGYNSIDDLYNGTSYTADCSYFDIAYATMVLKVKNKYPNASIYLCNLIYNDTLGQSYNESIEKIATEFDCNIVDFSTLVPVWSWSGHTMDGLHPNKDGFDLMADILTRTIQETFMQN